MNKHFKIIWKKKKWYTALKNDFFPMKKQKLLQYRLENSHSNLFLETSVIAPNNIFCFTIINIIIIPIFRNMLINLKIVNNFT